MGTAEMRTIGSWMLGALRAPEDDAVLKRISNEIRTLCQQFPVPAVALNMQ
jgi:glycine/serine hydroxymethyltransferase